MKRVITVLRMSVKLFRCVALGYGCMKRNDFRDKNSRHRNVCCQKYSINQMYYAIRRNYMFCPDMLYLYHYSTKTHLFQIL